MNVIQKKNILFSAFKWMNGQVGGNKIREHRKNDRAKTIISVQNKLQLFQIHDLSISYHSFTQKNNKYKGKIYLFAHYKRMTELVKDTKMMRDSECGRDKCLVVLRLHLEQGRC